MKSYENDHPNYSSLEEAFSRNEIAERAHQASGNVAHSSFTDIAGFYSTVDSSPSSVTKLLLRF